MSKNHIYNFFRRNLRLENMDSYICKLWLLFMLLPLVLYKIVDSQSVKSLPGFPGNLPFNLETGYVGVGESDDVQLFYYFIESERNPVDDPLLLWLTGGPGCSAFSGLVYEIGPLTFDYPNSRGHLPTFVLNPYSWTKVANIIFLDAPVGTGFSYATSWEGYNSNDTLSAAQIYDFLRKWLIDHPKFLENPLYITGDSYSGMIVPVIVQEILTGLELGHQPQMNLIGYILGNPVTNLHIDGNSKIQFAYHAGLISDEIYESTKRACNDEYIDVDPNNAACLYNLRIVSECTEKLRDVNILEPKCLQYSSERTVPNRYPRSLRQMIDPIDFNISQHKLPRKWCRETNYFFSYAWANDISVQNALNIRKGTINYWVRCNHSLPYTYDITSTVDYHKNITNKHIRALIYCGDHDLYIPYLGTLAWIKSLNLPILSGWQPWFVDGQVGGYTMGFANYKYWLTFATIKAGGHTAPEYKPKECLAMVDRWLAYFPL